ncbi:hypothetical protein SAMN05444320_109165 [Streptoalloteichus hindustanus]|uniref:Uncharacterized protein n=1 Tax=Streptoalloteichus hindustanus TaxID=2017 RepID=A0A1M5K6W8_STRHI|nr:hypothetical protein SAMN05444320_109165 [Streptoalloteichus hindustanus]
MAADRLLRRHGIPVRADRTPHERTDGDDGTPGRAGVAPPHRLPPVRLSMRVRPPIPPDQGKPGKPAGIIPRSERYHRSAKINYSE